jgi:branched-chain amino acid transport system permease protein
MFLDLLAQTIVTGVLVGLILALASIGMTVIFGIMRIFNIASGDMVVLGCYVIFWLNAIFALDPIIGFPVAISVGVVLGAGVYYFVIRHIVRTVGLRSLMVLFGVSSILSNSMLVAWEPLTRTVPVFYPNLVLAEVTIPGNKLLPAIVSVITTIMLLVVLNYTYFGRSIRATVSNWKAASLVGINVNKIYAAGFTIGITLTVFAGALISLVYPIEPYGGLPYSLYAFTIVILGTVGDPVGCLVAGLIIGLATSFTGSYWTQGMAPAVSYIILVLTFLIKPEGLFGKRR